MLLTFYESIKYDPGNIKYMDMDKEMEMVQGNTQTACRQCGTCCKSGGAALHHNDMALLLQGVIPRWDLITIRKGEFAHNPVSGKVQATVAEIVKLRGKGREWECCYYEPVSKDCSIYGTRPQACSTLKCWDPGESLKLVETDLLSRIEILGTDSATILLIAEHDGYCPLPDFKNLGYALDYRERETLHSLDKSVNDDIAFRNHVVTISRMILKDEMFLFGRPLFQMLHPFGLDVILDGTELSVRINRNRRRGTVEKYRD